MGGIRGVIGGFVDVRLTIYGIVGAVGVNMMHVLEALILGIIVSFSEHIYHLLF